MSIVFTYRKRGWKWKASPRIISLLIVLLIFAFITALRHAGGLQFLEFYSYDFLIRHQAKSNGTNPVVLIEMTEEDIQSPSLDYPIYDDKLAELLRILAEAKPAAIGLDIYRDIPVPKNGSGRPQLNEVLQTHSNIIAGFTLSGILPPPVLRLNSDRVGFLDNFPPDVGVDRTVPKVRRSLLLASQSGQEFNSLSFQLALLYLKQQGIEPSPDPSNSRGFLLGRARMAPLRANDGAYVGADAHGWQMLLDFKGSERFDRYSFSQALAHQIPVENLHGKIILMGMNAPSVSDERVTPIRRDHRGVEVQAATVDQLLRRALEGARPLRFWNDWAEDAFVLLWCLIGGAVGYLIRSSWRFAAAVVFCMLVLAGTVWMAFALGWWIPATTPALGFAPAAALVVSYLSAEERTMRNVLMTLYSRHVSKEIAESTWKNRDSFLDGSRPVAQKLIVTVLFTDLKGFSAISEKMEPTRLYEWLNRYLGTMAQEIQKHGGVLKQFTGDGILALFGVPVPHSSLALQSTDATAAVRCALAMGERLVELSHQWHEAGLPAVSMRAGIYTGEAAAGSVGSDERFEYAVIGDVVNTASRLESYDKTLADPDSLPNRCRILIGAPTFNLLGDCFVSKEIGLLEVKGKANKVKVVQILQENRIVPRPTAELSASPVQ